MSCQSIRKEIFYLLPPGKPNPKTPKSEKEEDFQERVPQAPQKGPTCWFYSQKLIRKQLGPCPPLSLLKESVLARLASSYRKELTKASIQGLEEHAIAELYRSSPLSKGVVHSSAPSSPREYPAKKPWY